MKTKIQLAAGDKLTMDCMSSGYPVPVIKWRRVDGRPLPVRTITHSKGLLSIHDVGQLDRGEYECISSNIYGNDTRIFSVNMRGTTAENSDICPVSYGARAQICLQFN